MRERIENGWETKPENFEFFHSLIGVLRSILAVSIRIDNANTKKMNVEIKGKIKETRRKERERKYREGPNGSDKDLNHSHKQNPFSRGFSPHLQSLPVFLYCFLQPKLAHFVALETKFELMAKKPLRALRNDWSIEMNWKLRMKKKKYGQWMREKFRFQSLHYLFVTCLVN